MPTIVEKRIHLFLVAYTAQSFLLICNFEMHDALAMPFPLLEPAFVDVAGLGVDHLTLAIWVIIRPATGVSIAVGKVHLPRARLGARDKVAGITVADGGNKSALTMRSAVGNSARKIWGGEVGGLEVRLEVSRVTSSGPLVTEEAGNCCGFASSG